MYRKEAQIQANKYLCGDFHHCPAQVSTVGNIMSVIEREGSPITKDRLLVARKQILHNNYWTSNILVYSVTTNTKRRSELGGLKTK